MSLFLDSSIQSKAKIMDFFFENEVSEEQKKAALASAKLEDSHGPFGLSKSASAAFP